MANNKKIDWFEMWFDDKKSIISTMERNIQSDLDAGYDPLGHIITKQVDDLNDYIDQFNYDIEMLQMMTEEETNHWCRLDMKKRGAID